MVKNNFTFFLYVYSFVNNVAGLGRQCDAVYDHDGHCENGGDLTLGRFPEYHSFEACLEKCQRNSECEEFSILNDDAEQPGKCNLFRAGCVVGKHQTADRKHYKLTNCIINNNCNGESDFKFWNNVHFSVDGNKLTDLGEIDSKEKCMNKCHKKNNCQAFVYYPEAKACTLLTDVFEVDDNNGVISGTKCSYDGPEPEHMLSGLYNKKDGFSIFVDTSIPIKMEYTSDLDNEDSEAYKNAANSIDDFFGDTFQAIADSYGADMIVKYKFTSSNSRSRGSTEVLIRKEFIFFQAHDDVTKLTDDLIRHVKNKATDKIANGDGELINQNQKPTVGLGQEPFWIEWTNEFLATISIFPEESFKKDMVQRTGLPARIGEVFTKSGCRDQNRRRRNARNANDDTCTVAEDLTVELMSWIEDNQETCTSQPWEKRSKAFKNKANKWMEKIQYKCQKKYEKMQKNENLSSSL